MTAKRKGSAKRAVAYVRVSTDEQNLGPEAQRSAIEAWAEANGVRVVAWHHDLGVSGAKAPDERPGLCAALGSLRERKAGHLVVAVRDRLARDVYGAAAVEAAAKDVGAVVTSVEGRNGDTPEDFLFRALEDYMAMVERLKIAQRTKAAMAQAAKRGRLVGSVPYGFTTEEREDGTYLRPLASEQRVVRRILDLRAEGLSYARVAEALNAKGPKPRSGGRWYAMQVKRVCERAA